MAKKKKLQLKVANRGFATTSIPKKVEPENTALEPEGRGNQTPVVPTTANTPAIVNSQNSNSSNDDALRLFADKWQAKTVGEIDRLVKVKSANQPCPPSHRHFRLETSL